MYSDFVKVMNKEENKNESIPLKGGMKYIIIKTQKSRYYCKYLDSVQFSF